jgi:hypothetical protein
MRKQYMKNLILLISLLSLGSVIAPSASSAATSGTETADAAKPKKKSTDVNFDDVLVQGKYHFSDEAVTTVEGDKVLDALLSVRTDFKDRMKKSASRH